MKYLFVFFIVLGFKMLYTIFSYISRKLCGVFMKKRVISAIVMILIFVPLMIIGKLPFKILMTIVGLLGLKELLDLEKEIPNFIKYTSYIFVALLIWFNSKGITDAFKFDYKILLGISLFYFLFIVLIGNNKKYNYKDALFILGAIFLMSISFNGFIVVRSFGFIELGYLFLIATLTDTFAYFSGSLLGKHKLSSLSPHKTVEGSIWGSVLGTLLTSLIYVSIASKWANWPMILLTTFALSIIGQFGDLFFSSIKRSYNVKDFSNIIPGHGGILDRFDSLIFILIGYILILL